MRGKYAVSRPLAQGFTLVELMVVIGILAVLLGVSTVNLSRPQGTATLTSAVETLVADIKSQQLKTMAGDSQSASSAQQHGIRLNSNSYILFKGATYAAADADNLTVNLESGVVITSTLPLVGGARQVLFTKGNGSVVSFSASANVITLTNNFTGEVRTITINRYGALTVS